MTNNDRVLLDNGLDAAQATCDAPMAPDRAFELFACEQVLRMYELSPDDVESGIVGGGDDGALDGVYVFLGGRLLAEDDQLLSDDSTPSGFERDMDLALWVIQAKRQTSFTETAVDLVSSSLGRLLDLQRDEDDLIRLYSADVVERVRMFTTAWQKIATRRPKLQIRFVYATRGDTESIHDKVRTKATELEQELQRLVPGATAEVRFYGAAELWARYNEVPSYTLSLAYEENATSGSSHVALVTLDAYHQFITDDGTLRRHIFDWNVRDYQGDVEVNREIRDSVADPAAPEFWWMNNGVTVVCSSARIVGKTYILDDVQIVNGLQTSHAIYETFRQPGEHAEARARRILVRILATEDAEIRDRVIRATNRQTSVPSASLRATDEIQRKIESYFAAHEWYYDRRKNYYRNIGKPAERIVSIPMLAQAVMAMGFGEASNSRARPSSLLKKDEDYRRVFSADIPLGTYLWIAKTQRRIDNFLASEAGGATASERTNFRFYVSMLLAVKAMGARVYSAAQLSELAKNDHVFTDAEIKDTLEHVQT